MPSPDRLVVVAGTGTEVGKTWWTCAVIGLLRTRGIAVAARKPAQSFDPTEPVDARDATLLADATGETAEDVCRPSRSYPVAMAPPMAADALGRERVRLADLLRELTWPAGVEIGFVETAGGVRSPLAHDGDNLAFIDALAPTAVVLVADAGLGTINLVRLAAGVLAAHRVIVALNRFDPANDLHVRNRAWLTDIEGLEIAVSVDDLAARWIA